MQDTLQEASRQEASRPRAARGRHVTAGLVFAVLAAAVLTLAGWVNVLPEAPDAWTYDWRTATFSPRAAKQRSDIAVVLIGEESLSRYASIVPIDRGLLATLVRAIDAAGPKAIGLDFLFERETAPEKTAALRAAIASARAPVVLGNVDARLGEFSSTQIAYHQQFLAKSGSPLSGHVIVAHGPQRLSGSDQVVRYMTGPADMSQGRPLPSFAEVLAGADRNGRMPEIPASRLISWLRPPAAGGGGVFPTIEVPPHAPGSPEAVILPPDWRGALKDRIVLVGGNLADRDQHLTPLSVTDGRKMPGVLIQAQILAQLRDGRAVFQLPYWAEAVCLAVIAGIGYWLARRWRLQGHGVLAGTVGTILLIASGILCFWLLHLVLPSQSFFLAWVSGLWGGQSRLWAWAAGLRQTA